MDGFTLHFTVKKTSTLDKAMQAFAARIQRTDCRFVIEGKRVTRFKTAKDVRKLSLPCTSTGLIEFSSKFRTTI